VRHGGHYDYIPPHHAWHQTGHVHHCHR
jgi:hypothetical protein